MGLSGACAKRAADPVSVGRLIFIFCFETVEKAGWTARRKNFENRLLFFSSRKASCTLKKIKSFKSAKTAQWCGFYAFCLLLGGQYLEGPPKSHMAFWREEKCTLEASNRRKKLFKRRLRTYRRAFRRRPSLAKYKIQLAFLAVSQRVRLYNLLPLYLFRRGLFGYVFAIAGTSALYSTVTDLARLRGLSMSHPFSSAQ